MSHTRNLSVATFLLLTSIFIFVKFAKSHILLDGYLEGGYFNFYHDAEEQDEKYRLQCLTTIEYWNLPWTAYDIHNCFIDCVFKMHNIFYSEIVIPTRRPLVNLTAITKLYKTRSNASDGQVAKAIEIYNFTLINTIIEHEVGWMTNYPAYYRACSYSHSFYHRASYVWEDDNLNRTWSLAIIDVVA